MMKPPVVAPGEEVLEQLRQLWVTANADSISRDILRARALAKTVPARCRADADDFVIALERLERWLRDA